MANFYGDAHGLAEIVDCDEVHAARAQSTRVEIFFSADDDLLVRAADLNHVERRTGGHAESFALADGEVVNAVVLADDFAAGGDQLAGGVGQCFALFGEKSVDEALVIAAGDETDFLRVGLLGRGEAVLAGEVADLGLGHVSKRKQSAAELLLGEAEKKIRLVLALVGGTPEQPAPTSIVVVHAGGVTGGNAVGADLASDHQKLIELHVIIAEAAGNGSASGGLFRGNAS